MEEEAKLAKVAHVVCLPLPALGHFKPLLKLAELLCESKANNIKITFVTTQSNYDRLLVSANPDEFHQSHPNFHFKTFSAQLGGRGTDLDSFLSLSKAALRELCLSHPTCLAVDMILSSFALEVVKELEFHDIPVFCFQQSGAGFMWINLHLSNLLEQGAIPIQDEDLGKPFTQIPGFESLFRFRDLPSGCRMANFNKTTAELFLIEQFKSASQTSALIINTFDGLEASTISKLSSYYSKIFSIGPLNHFQNTQIQEYYSLWEEDNSCLTWLDSKPSESVLFVSFGSRAILKTHQLLELRHGLVNSGVPFLWVIRPDSIFVDGDTTGSSQTQILMELEEKTKGKGQIVSWAPQQKVLTHSAIGGFLTHSGWNSTMESICAGIPMICWPIEAEQHVTSRFVSELWWIGFDMKDTCDRSIIEKMVRDLFGNKREEIMKSMNKISEKAQQSVMEGGSSYCNLEKLINYIISLIP